MKIRQRITLIFTGLTFLIMVCAFAIIYSLLAQSSKENYWEYLEGRLSLEMKALNEPYMVGSRAISYIADNVLPELIEIQVMQVPSRISYRQPNFDTFKTVMPERLARKLINGEDIRFQNGKRLGVGMHFLTLDYSEDYIIVLSAIDKSGHRDRQKILRILMAVLAAGLVTIYIAGSVYSKQIIRPIANITQKMNSIRSSKLSERMKEPENKDELGELIATFNRMLDRLENAFEMQRVFIGNASHELKNPITAILGKTEIALRKDRTREQYVETLEQVEKETERLDSMTKNLLLLAQTHCDFDEMQKETFRIDEMIWNIVDKIEYKYGKDRLKIEIVNLPEDDSRLQLTGLESLLTVAVGNIFDNACKFSDNKPVYVMLDYNDKEAKIIVKDQGIGIREEEMKKLFTPFFRSRNAISYQGSGIGLSLAKQVIEQHNGTISITSESGVGTIVTIVFH